MFLPIAPATVMRVESCMRGRTRVSDGGLPSDGEAAVLRPYGTEFAR
ncbi:hypothetical protein [Streptomyces sp. NPDC004065]